MYAETVKMDITFTSTLLLTDVDHVIIATLSDHSYLYAFVSKYVPLTLMMSYIIFFDINLVDGPLNSFILCSQIDRYYILYKRY